MTRCYVGLMSGTSLDGADAVLVDLTRGAQVLAHRHAPFAPTLRGTLLALNAAGGPDELHRAALAANALALHYAGLVESVLEAAGAARAAVRAVGAHGQTVRHRPGEYDGTGYTLQLLNGALLAERCGIDVVCDFRSRDVAAGGQGAPLVPAFHQALFARPGTAVAVLNLGGISNLTLLGADGSLRGFDCGPANGLLDGWWERHHPAGAGYDDGGRWAASGRVDTALLGELLAEPYFHRAPPKSTGRDLFHLGWLDGRLQGRAVGAADVQATLAELLVRSVAADVDRHAADTTELLVCGGGAHNAHVMGRLQAALPQLQVETTAARGLDVGHVEAAAFAWLAARCLDRLPGNAVGVTGASGPRVLGAIYPA